MKGWPLNQKDDEPPCIGICYYHKKKCFEDGQCSEYDKGNTVNIVEERSKLIFI